MDVNTEKQLKSLNNQLLRETFIIGHSDDINEILDAEKRMNIIERKIEEIEFIRNLDNTGWVKYTN